MLARVQMASAGLRGGQRRCRRKFSELWLVACHCGGTEDQGSLSRLSPPRAGRGHTCPTPPRTCSVSNAIRTIRRVPSWHVSVVHTATEVAEHAVLVVHASLGAAVQRRLRKYSEDPGPWCTAARIRITTPPENSQWRPRTSKHKGGVRTSRR